MTRILQEGTAAEDWPTKATSLSVTVVMDVIAHHHNVETAARDVGPDRVEEAWASAPSAA